MLPIQQREFLSFGCLGSVRALKTKSSRDHREKEVIKKKLKTKSSRDHREKEVI